MFFYKLGHVILINALNFTTRSLFKHKTYTYGQFYLNMNIDVNGQQIYVDVGIYTTCLSDPLNF